MSFLKVIREHAESGDLILVGGDGWLSRLIQNGQSPQTRTGTASLWSHIMMYVNEQTVWESTIDFTPYGKSKRKSFF